MTPLHYCTICGCDIQVQIFKNTGVCSENCRKKRDNDYEPSRGLMVGLTEAPIGGELKASKRSQIEER